MLVIASEPVATAYPDINIDVCLRPMDAKLTGAGPFGVLIAAACCAGLPAAAALVGGLTIAGIVGLLAGALALAGLIALIALRTRAKRGGSTPPTTQGPAP